MIRHIKPFYAKENYVKVNLKEPTVQEIAEEIGIAKEEIVYAAGCDSDAGQLK